MPNELTIKPVQAKGPTSDPPKTREPSHGEAAPAAQPSRPYVNPSLRLDAALGLVVIEFRDDKGKLTSSIPSQRQIDAYRSHQEPRATTEARDDAKRAEPEQAEPPPRAEPEPG